MRYAKLILIVFAVAGVLACQKEQAGKQAESAVDTLPFPYDQNKDLTTAPGDDFWQYCNGGWAAKTPTPDFGSVGGIGDMDPLMQLMVSNVVSEDPSLFRFSQLSDQLYENADAGKAYLASLMTKYAKPATREDCLRLFGRMAMDGLDVSGLSLRCDWKDGEMIGLYSMPNSLYQYTFDQLPDAVKPIMSLIAEGMEIDPGTLYYNDQTVYVLNLIGSLDLDTMYMGATCSLKNLYPFVSEDLNASLGGAAKEPAQVRSDARACLNYLISNRVASRYVTPELKQHYQGLVERLREAFRIRINNAEWMSRTTRNNALEKLNKMQSFVGYPDIWYEDCLPDLSQCQSLVEAVCLLKAANARLYRHLIGTGDAFSYNITGSGYNARGEFLLTDLTMVNSYYKREYNCIVILPAFMLPPIMDLSLSEACQYGALFIVAHEITHGFDSEGSKYDAVGRLRNWWTVADKMAFEDQQNKLVQCYSSLEYDPVNYPGKFTDGARTLAENIADLGGFLITRDAYLKRLQEQGFSGENLEAQLKKFYESLAELYRIKYCPSLLKSIVETDNHSHCRLRTNGIVMNSDMWYQLYNVTPENLLYLPPERRTYIW